jgi:hypothetical protein
MADEKFLRVSPCAARISKQKIFGAKNAENEPFETAETQWFVFSLHFLVLRKLSYRVLKAIV